MKSRGSRIGLFILCIAAIINLLVFRASVDRNDRYSTPLNAAKHPNGGDTTIIITSSLIPSHPSLVLIDETIESLRFIEGLPNDSPIVIAVDGAYEDVRSQQAPKNRILNKYIHALHQKYGHDPRLTILSDEKNIKLVGNVRKATELVETEFVYLVQHDMPFIAPINHSALVSTFHNNAEKVRLVRFSPRKTLVRARDRVPGVCEPDEIEFHGDGVSLSKTHTWSDNNHFTTKKYYDEMFATIHGWDDVRYMEAKMKLEGFQNCSYWGTYLYGAIGDRPMIVHRDGRKFGLQSLGT